MLDLSEEMSEPTDSLALPLPPVGLDFSIRSGSQSTASVQRYIRKGTARDASAAIVGKGGFGTAYRYVRDGSFTPPSSTLDNSSGGEMWRAKSREEDCDSMESLRQTMRYCDNNDDTRMHDAPELKKSSLQHLGSASRRENMAVATMTSKANGSLPVAQYSPLYASDRSRSKIPAVLVLKVCRTPASGSYDELPKTGRGREEAKIASHQLTTGEVNGYHTRIVRGEARLLRYLQMVHSLKKKRGEPSYVVRLLADVPHTTMPSGEGETDEAVLQAGPPVPRLLIFERLVDLDAELTPKGWAKCKSLWTVDKVESIARDIIAGLAFLHEHHVVHGDLKPSNCMQDPKTGRVKLIDMGASRRWVRLPNAVKECTTAVEEFDKAVKDGEAGLLGRDEILCEGLGSLTGSPHYMAPEVLLQAGRYLAADGYPKSILDDYIYNYECLDNLPERDFLVPAYEDFKRGWGRKADVWSWGCTVISLLLRTLPSEQRPDSNTICAFDFQFNDGSDALEPLNPMHESNATLPRFHQWARIYPLRIMALLYTGIPLPSFTDVFSDTMLALLQATFQQCDARPHASAILDALDAISPVSCIGISLHSQGSQRQQQSRSDASCSNKPGMSRDLPRRPPGAWASSSPSNSVLSHADAPDNVDLTESVSASARHLYKKEDQMATEGASQPCFIMLEPPPLLPPPAASQSGTAGVACRGGEVALGSAGYNNTLQQNTRENRLVHSPLTSPMHQLQGARQNFLPAVEQQQQQQQQQTHQSMQSAAAAMDLSPATAPTRSLASFHSQQQYHEHQYRHQHQGPPPAPALPERQLPGVSSPQPPSSSSVLCSSTILDDVFMEAYENEERRMSPVPSIRLSHPAELKLGRATNGAEVYNEGEDEGSHTGTGTGTGTVSRKKPTGGLLGLGLDLHLPLRSVRSNLSLGGKNDSNIKTRTPSHSPSHSPYRLGFESCAAAEKQHYLPHHQGRGTRGANDFLMRDPFPRRGGGGGGGGGEEHSTLGAFGASGVEEDNKSGDVPSGTPSTRRGRSWSSLFKRKKMLKDPDDKE